MINFKKKNLISHIVINHIVKVSFELMPHKHSKKFHNNIKQTETMSAISKLFYLQMKDKKIVMT